MKFQPNHPLSFMVALAVGVGLMLSPMSVLADGYNPLNLPDRGQGPNSGVQGESVQKDANGNPIEATPSASPEAVEDTVGSFTGDFKEVRDGKLVVEVNGEEREVEVADDVKVTRDGEDSSLDQIQSGDSVTVDRNEDGSVNELRVASEQTMDFWRTVFPIALVVLGAFYFLTRKRPVKKA
jgi:hypothetical protein